MAKQLLVSSAVQAALLNDFLIQQMQDGFWREMRPAGHGAVWVDVKAEVSPTDMVGPVGFVPMKNYDFLNPEFTKLHEDHLVQVAQSVKQNMTFKALKKELIELARIIGGRMTDKTKEPARLFRGNNRADFDVIRSVERTKVVTAAGSTSAAPADAKKTVVKKTKPAVKKTVPVQDGNIEIITTSSGATVRRVAVKAVPVEA